MAGHHARAHAEAAHELLKLLCRDLAVLGDAVERLPEGAVGRQLVDLILGDGAVLQEALDLRPFLLKLLALLLRLSLFVGDCLPG